MCNALTNKGDDMTNNNAGLAAITGIPQPTDQNPALSPELTALRDQLAIHAPECPIWFLSKELGEKPWDNAHQITRAAKWPWYYADLVLSTRSDQSSL